MIEIRDKKGKFVNGHLDIARNLGRKRSEKTRKLLSEGHMGQTPWNKRENQIKGLSFIDGNWVRYPVDWKLIVFPGALFLMTVMVYLFA